VNNRTAQSGPRIAFFGMSGRLSAAPLQSLLDAGIDVCVYVTPGLRNMTVPEGARPAPRSRRKPERAIPMLGPKVHAHARQIADESGVPVLAVPEIRDHSILATLHELAPDIICVSCFPWRLPDEVIGAARLASMNIHPSLLPDNRGPDPLFWTFRRGDDQTGVTIHRMTAAFDAGPILAQTSIPVADGETEAMLEDALARQAASLLPAVVSAVAEAALPSENRTSRLPHISQPTVDDYRMDATRSARWNFNFVCGVRERQVPIELAIADRVYRVLSAISYDSVSFAPMKTDDDSVLVLRCNPGMLTVRAVRIR